MAKCLLTAGLLAKAAIKGQQFCSACLHKILRRFEKMHPNRADSRKYLQKYAKICKTPKLAGFLQIFAKLHTY